MRRFLFRLLPRGVRMRLNARKRIKREKAIPLDGSWMPDQKWLDQVDADERKQSKSWSQIAKTNSIAEIEEYLERWPEGVHMNDAADRIDEILAENAKKLGGLPPHQRLKGPVFMFSVVLTADGSTAVTGGRKSIDVWELRSGKVERSMAGHTRDVGAVALTPGDKLLFSASEDKTLKLWDFASGNIVDSFEWSQYGISGAAMSKDGRVAVLKDAMNVLTFGVWDLACGELRHTLKTDSYRCGFAISEDGRFAVTGEFDDCTGKVRVWDCVTGQVIAALAVDDAPHAIAINPSNNAIIFGFCKPMSAEKLLLPTDVVIWDWASTSEVRRLGGHTGGVVALTTSGDGTTAVSVGTDLTLRVWDLASGRERHRLIGAAKAPRCIDISRDGKTVVACEERLLVWRLPA
jgi:WD40 repeat protein